MFSYPTEKYRKQRKEELLLKYGKLEAFTLGKSILSRDIDCFKVGKGKQKILAVGAHHALEYITSLALYDFIEFLLENRTRPPLFCDVSLDFLLSRYTYFIVPAVNPDGLEIHLNSSARGPLYDRCVKMNGSADFSLWQANARGVDLNHNYPVGFSEYKLVERKNGISAGKTRYSGEYAQSEPEVRAVSSLISSVDFSYVVSFHTQGREIFYSPRNERTARMARQLCRITEYSIAEPNEFSAYGGLCDYTGTLGIPSFTVELARGKNPLPESSYPEAVSITRKILLAIPKL
jgi:g-D-glutamyl-meso-diaminopimelate peptidase